MEYNVKKLLDSTCTSVTISSSSNSTNYTNISALGTSAPASTMISVVVADASEPELENVLYGRIPDVTCPEIGSRLDIKSDKLIDAMVTGDIDSPTSGPNSTARLPERIKLIIEEIEREETAWREDLYSSDRKFAEYYNVLEQILGVLIKLVKEIKLQHQHKYDELHKTWLCKRCETMNAKLRVLEHVLLYDTYTPETIGALHKIRKYLVDSTDEASLAYNKAVTRLREYQGVDPHFDSIARQYHEIVKKLENLRWTIHQVEMDLNRST
nr:AUGMIN subunit 4-like [Coffea arabica]